MHKGIGVNLWWPDEYPQSQSNFGKKKSLQSAIYFYEAYIFKLFLLLPFALIRNLLENNLALFFLYIP